MRRLRVPRFARTPSGAVGLILFTAVVLIALFGPLLAAHPIDKPIGGPGMTPGGEAVLGTDALGRDVLSRTLHGGLSVLGLGLIATVLSYLLGLLIGLTAGYSRSIIDAILMRSVDVLLAFPALVILLLLVSGLGQTIPVLVAGVVLIQLPGIARVVRTATLEVTTRGYVEAAVARGERTPAILTREVLPNISGIVLADIGLRFGFSVILIASMNYLGLGLQPPTADWGLMISENRQIISLNVWSVVAPAIFLATLTVAVSLIGDAYARSLGSSAAATRRRARAPGRGTVGDPSTGPSAIG